MARDGVHALIGRIRAKKKKRYASWMVLDTSLGTRKLLLDIFFTGEEILATATRNAVQLC